MRFEIYKTPKQHKYIKYSWEKFIYELVVLFYATRARCSERYIPVVKGIDSEINRIYHHTVEGTRESHPSVHDLQSTTRLAVAPPIR